MRNINFSRGDTPLDNASLARENHVRRKSRVIDVEPVLLRPVRPTLRGLDCQDLKIAFTVKGPLDILRMPVVSLDCHGRLGKPLDIFCG